MPGMRLAASGTGLALVSCAKLHACIIHRPRACVCVCLRCMRACMQMFAKLMGIDHVMDTVVGDELLKGISGGQKRRVTCGESC